MVVAIYLRTSKVDQNPENQKASLIRWCEAMGHSYEIFEEQESTRKTRWVKNEVLQKALLKKYDTILVWKLDRWARSLQELINDLEIFKKYKVEFHSLSDQIHLDDNPSNILFIQILGAFAQFERSIIRERTMLGLERAKKEGKIFGRPSGKKDKSPRRKSGYFLRWTRQKEYVLKNRPPSNDTFLVGDKS